MAVLNETALSKSLRDGKLSPVYFLYGKEAYRMEKCVAAIIKKSVGKQNSCFNLRQFDGNQASVSEIIEAVEAYPVMAPLKCVTVSNLNIETLPEKDYNLLKELVKDPPETTVLVFYNTAVEVNLKKSAKYKAFSGLIEKSGTVTEFAYLSQAQLEKLLLETAAKNSCQLSPYLACYLMDKCGDSLSVLLTELEKLCCYTGAGEITREAVDLLAAKSVESSAFDLSKAILKREYSRSFHILDELFDQRLEPLAIMGALNMSFSDLYKAAIAKAEQIPINKVIDDFGYKGRDFRIKNAFRDVSAFSLPQIRQCLSILSEADQKLKSSRTDGQTLLELVIAKMIAVKEDATV